jgi:molybdopterin-guanine dinucleotide biosynthesis protein A
LAGSPAGYTASGKRRGTRIHSVFNEASSRIVEEAELRDAGFGAELFANVNTPEEFAALSLRLQP